MRVWGGPRFEGINFSLVVILTAVLLADSI